MLHLGAIPHASVVAGGHCGYDRDNPRVIDYSIELTERGNHVVLMENTGELYCCYMANVSVLCSQGSGQTCWLPLFVVVEESLPPKTVTKHSPNKCRVIRERLPLHHPRSSQKEKGMSKKRQLRTRWLNVKNMKTLHANWNELRVRLFSAVQMWQKFRSGRSNR